MSFTGAVGLDEKQRTADAEATAKREIERRKERRENEKKEVHNQKEVERQNIRSKYKLQPKGADAKKTTHNSKPKETESSSENKCTIS